MLLPRVLTAIVGIPLILWLIHSGGLPFLVFVLIVTALSLYEYGVILEVGRLPVRRWTVLVSGVLVAFGLAVGTPRLGAAGNQLAAFALTLAIGWSVSAELFAESRSLDRAALTLFGVLFVGWTLPHLYLLRDVRPWGEGLTWMLVVSVWCCDTAAYFVGKAVGRHRLTVVSPKKTVEGGVAGFLASVGASLAVRSALIPGAMPAWEAAALGAGLGLIGQASDICESLLKRAAGVKDSGSVLPGHGGMLDRFDSFLLAGPFMYYMAALQWR
jgi:phosphatidate cytidylyltransferase